MLQPHWALGCRSWGAAPAQGAWGVPAARPGLFVGPGVLHPLQVELTPGLRTQGASPVGPAAVGPGNEGARPRVRPHTVLM